MRVSSISYPVGSSSVPALGLLTLFMQETMKYVERFLRYAGLNHPVLRYGLPALFVTLLLQWSTRRRRQRADAIEEQQQRRNNKTFTLMEPENKTDLGWASVVSFGLPTISRCIETFFIFRYGLKRAMAGSGESPRHVLARA